MPDFSWTLYWIIAAVFTAPFWGLVILLLISSVIELHLTYICERPYKTPKIFLFAWNLFEDDCDKKDDVNEFADDDIAKMVLVYIFCPPILFALWPITGFIFFYWILLRTLRFMVRIKKAITQLITNKKCLKEYTEEDIPKMEF